MTAPGPTARPVWHARSGLTALAVALLLAGLLEFALGWSLALLGGGLMLTVVGAPMAIAALFVVRRFARIERRVASRVLGERIAFYYRPLTGNWWRRVRILAGDPATWRDLAWLGIAATYGTVLCAAVAVLALGVLWYAAFPLLWLVTPEGLFAADYGFWDFDSQATSFMAWAFAGAFTLGWWWATPQLLRLRARTARALLRPTEGGALRLRVEELATTRAEAVDASAAELRRIERDLHDGVQPRLVSLAMTIGLAQTKLDSDLPAAKALIAEAHDEAKSALVELRNVVRGIAPTILADRGLDAALSAVVQRASTSGVPTTLSVYLPRRLPDEVEACAYFVVAEALTNVTRHASAHQAAVTVRLDETAQQLHVTVFDDGCGGAQITGDENATGLRGLDERVRAARGTFTVSSPVTGPTIITAVLPCGS